MSTFPASKESPNTDGKRRGGWRKVKDEITCSICGSLFTDPKTIPCLHTFCKVCLERSIEMNKRLKSDVCCPLCRAKLPQDDVEAIPTNFVTERLIEIYAEEAQRRNLRRNAKCSDQTRDQALRVATAFPGDVFSASFSASLNSSLNPRPRSLYAANYSYSPTRDDEIAFNKGDLFDVLNIDDHNWWYVRNKSSGKVGQIPSNYISIVEFSKDQSSVSHIKASDTPLKSAESNSFQQLFITKYNYSPKREDELALNEGDNLDVINTDDPDWWLAKCKDSTQVGYVPSNYIIVANIDTKSDIVNERYYPVFKAKYSYSPRRKNELGFKEGDLFYIINTDDADWWLGKNKDLSGQVGYIPSNYFIKFESTVLRQSEVVTKEERKNPEPELSAYSSCIAKYNYLPRQENELGFNKGEILHVININDSKWWLAGHLGCIPSSSVSKTNEKVKAINVKYPLVIANYSYSAKRGNELSFKEGDLLHVVNNDDQNWWIAGQIGYIPSNYVSLLESARSLFGTTIDNSNYPLFVAKYSYLARTYFDLSFKKGDLLHIVRNDDDGWWLAKGSDGQEGCIPSSYVKEYKSLLDAEDWYYDAITQKHAGELLMQAPNDHGSFLIRDSVNTSSGYCLVVRDGITIKRWKINKSSDGNYFVNTNMTFESLPQLVAYHTMHTGEFLFEIMKTPCVPAEVQRTVGLSKATNKAWKIQRSSLKLCKKTDSGNFGEVWEAMWNNTTPVIVNTFNPGTITVSDFLKEATVMKQLRHRNIIQLYAVCVEVELIYIVTELMGNGNLRDYLQIDGRTSKLPQLINMGAQVAAGMAYLEKNTYIHGNLAARSVFVSQKLICRIGDFGFINVLSEETSKELVKFKTKWLAPEVLKFSCVTTKSDVWSFGVLLYEVVTHGQIPYPEMSNAQIQEKLQTGYRMPCPMSCPEQLYKIMMKCWNNSADCRPTFETLHWQLEDFFVNDIFCSPVTVTTPYLP